MSAVPSSLSVRELEAADEGAFLAAVARSRDLHGGWVAPPDTPEAFAAHLRRYAEDVRSSYVAAEGGGGLVGCINLNEIVRGAFQSAYLGYYAFEPFCEKGLMKQALTRVIAEAFGALGLHRLEANIQPSNAASIALVEALGFRLEGFSPRYLKVDGAWRDHLRYALTLEDWEAR